MIKIKNLLAKSIQVGDWVLDRGENLMTKVTRVEKNYKGEITQVWGYWIKVETNVKRDREQYCSNISNLEFIHDQS